MTRYSYEFVSGILARIRSILIQNSGITILEVQKILESDEEAPLHLDKNYIGKLIRKIQKERSLRIENNMLSVVLAQFEDEADIARDTLWSFVNDPGVDIADKIMALAKIRDISNNLIDKMFDAGVFERQLGKIKSEGALSPEQNEMVNKALTYVLGYRKDNKNKAITGPEASSTPAAN